MGLIDQIPEQLRANPEFQSSMVRIAAWVFGLCYIGFGIWAGLFTLYYPAFFSLLGAYLVLNLGILFSVLLRAEWEARRYLALFFDILAVSLAIFLTGDGSSPLFLFYILIFISAATRYGRRHLAVAATAAVVSYNGVLLVTGFWPAEPMDAAFRVLMLVLLPLYQDSLLRKLREARRAAEQANQAKSAFLANMTHELRTPLTGVLGMAELLRTTELEREQRDYVDAISSSASMLQALIGDILDLSKIDAGKLHLEDRPFDLRETIKQVCTVLHAQAASKGIEMICDVSPDLPRLVRGDQLRVRQILFNLIGNAVKFTETGEIVVRAAPAPDPAQGPGRGSDSASAPAASCARHRGLLLQIEDTGIGIPEDQLDAIFEGFSQADDSTTRRFGGTGLGTTISRDLITLMGGHIELRSKLGEGTCFSIRLPLQGQESPAPDLQTARKLPCKRVLIHQRNPRLGALIARTCEAQGMTCLFDNDIDGLDQAAAGRLGTDLIIIDDPPNRPDASELGAAHERVDKLSAAPVPQLLLIDGTRRSVFSRCNSFCLSKPFLPDELVAAMAAALGEQPADTGPATHAQNPVAAGRGARVLVAEDNAIASRVIRTLLERQGCSVTVVQDGHQALLEARAGGFDLAFIDLRMPGLDGIGFTEQLRASEREGQHLNIVTLTANAAEDVKRRCLAAGMDHFLTKPIDPSALSDTLTRYGIAVGRD
jgi:two-component system sensor histidine kinase RpfC